MLFFRFFQRMVQFLKFSILVMLLFQCLLVFFPEIRKTFFLIFWDKCSAPSRSYLVPPWMLYQCWDERPWQGSLGPPDPSLAECCSFERRRSRMIATRPISHHHLLEKPSLNGMSSPSRERSLCERCLRPIDDSKPFWAPEQFGRYHQECWVCARCQTPLGG